MDREAWRAAVHGVTKSRTRLSDWSDLIWSALLVFPFSFSSVLSKLGGDGVQDMLPPNTASWHTKYLLIEIGDTAHAGKTDSPLEQVIRHPCERRPPSTQGQGDSLPPRDAERNVNDQALLSSPQFTTLSSYPVLSHFFMTPLLIKPKIKAHRFNCFSGSSFPYEGSGVT